MKFLVISDIHGSADYMEKALEAYTRHKPDQIGSINFGVGGNQRLFFLSIKKET